MKEVIGHYELSLVPGSLMDMDGSLILGHMGKSKLMNAIIECLEMPATEDAEDLLEDRQNTTSTCVIHAMVVHSLNMKGRNIETCKDFAKIILPTV